MLNGRPFLIDFRYISNVAFLRSCEFSPIRKNSLARVRKETQLKRKGSQETGNFHFRRLRTTENGGSDSRENRKRVMMEGHKKEGKIYAIFCRK